MAEGVQEVADAELVLRRVAETTEAIERMKLENNYSWQVYQSLESIPTCTVDDLAEASGVLFGCPTRFGNMSAAMKLLIDNTTQLWLKGAMEGKPAGVFTSTA